MRIFILLTVTLALSVGSYAKDINSYKKFYRMYRDADYVTTFKIPAGLARIFIDRDEKEAKEFMKKMDDISFFISEQHNNQMIFDLNKNLPEKDYKEMMIVKDGEMEVTFMARDEGDGVITEIIMAVYDPRELVVMCMTGEFTSDDARKIAKSIKTETAINFRKD